MIAAFLFSACTQSSAPAPQAQEGPAPGIYQTPTPGIHAVRGTCTGRIALTPGIPHARGDGQPYPLVYDCASGTFRILERRTGTHGLADLTLTAEGYYLHQTSEVEHGGRGGYSFYDHQGKLVREPARPDGPRVHDLIVRGDEITYLRYVADWSAARCGRKAPLELEIVTENGRGERLWSWSSKGRFDASQKTATVESSNLAEGGRGGWFRSFRHCYTSLARRAVEFEPPKWFLGSGKYPLLHLEHDDYVHANSIQRLEPSGDILVSAAFLDTIFLVDRESGNVKWSLGGSLAKATRERPSDDSRGFSSQEFARISGNTLWVFDNGNHFPDLPSRAVAYRLDSSPLRNRLAFEFHEPNGKQRYALGSVQALGNDELLIGWGGVRPVDRATPQRAVSVVRLADGREVFSMDLAPGWVSYRVKALQP